MARVLVKTAGFEIGEIKASTATTLPGWICCDGKSIGNTGSGADFEGTLYQTLYNFLWALPGLSVTAGEPFQISSAKGADALSDWTANKIITIDFRTYKFLKQKGASDNMGTPQSDALQGHGHTVRTNTSSGSFAGIKAGNGSTSFNKIADPAWGQALGWAGQYIDAGFGAVRVDSETRPKNVAINYFIKF